MNTELFIGLMSGTSMDAIDAVLVEFGNASCTLRQTSTTAYPTELAARLRHIAAHPEGIDLDEIGELNARVAQEFANATHTLLAAANTQPAAIMAVGSHGQTILHRPDGDDPFSMQLGDPSIIAALVGAPVVADFRSADIALGGQGAPLVPAFHRWAFADATQCKAAINIGGIANVTILDPAGDTTGFDTGPGNGLMDEWCRRHQGTDFDRDGEWAAGGSVDEDLLTAMRADAYFSRPAPKSTGTDYFNADWLQKMLHQHSATPALRDVQATLCELTASTIADAINGVAESAVCGGGAFNTDLMNRLARHVSPRHITSTSAWGIDPEWVEAIAFAWLARGRLRGEPTNLPTVTGARREVSLGGVYLPPL